MELLSTASETHLGWTVVVARGPLDVATSPRLQQVLAEAQVADGAHVAVEVSGVEFVDAVGVGVLVGAHVRASLTGGAFALVAPNARLRDLLERTDLDSVLTLVPSEDDLAPTTG